MQKMFVIHYRMLVTLVKMIYTVNSKIISMATAAILKFLSLKRLLFIFVLNWVFLRFPWQLQAFWNFQASKPFIHMPYNISIKLHPSTLNFSHFCVATPVILKFLSLKIMCTHVRQNFWKFSSNSEHHSKPTMNINSQHHNLLGNQISPKLEDFLTLCPFWIKNGHHSKPTMDINSQHHNLLGNQISPKSEDFFILVAILDSKSKWPP